MPRVHTHTYVSCTHVSFASRYTRISEECQRGHTKTPEEPTEPRMHQRCREWTRPQREWRRRQPPVPAAASGLHSCPKAESAAAPPAPRRSRSRGHPDPLSPAAGAPRAAGRTLTGPGATTRRSRAARVRGRSPTHRAETPHGGGGGSRGPGPGHGTPGPGGE